MKWQTYSERPGHYILRAAKLANRHAEAKMADHGIGIASFQVFGMLRDGKKLSQKDLALMAQVEQPSMAQLLKRMERDGLIAREPDPQDGRSSLISLTDKAYALLPEVRATIDGFNDLAIKGMSAEEVETLIRLMRKMVENLEGDGLPAHPRLTD